MLVKLGFSIGSFSGVLGAEVVISVVLSSIRVVVSLIVICR